MRLTPFRIVASIALAAAAALAAEAAPDPAASTPEARIELGRYIVETSGCNDCHTPWHMTEEGPGPDMSRMLSGHPAGMEVPPPPEPVGPWIASNTATNTAWAGPWGISFSANLTPDDETGTGKWTEQEFIDTLRSGRHLGRGREILPPMPWPVYGKKTDEDLAAIYAYLQSIPPIKNKVPDPVPPKPAH
jgi:hypothetical protein